VIEIFGRPAEKDWLITHSKFRFRSGFFDYSQTSSTIQYWQEILDGIFA